MVDSFSGPSRGGAPSGALARGWNSLSNFFPFPDAMLAVLDADGVFLRVNEAWESVLGYPEDSLVGSKAIDLMAPEEAAPASDVDPRLFGRSPSAVRVKDARGKERWVRWSTSEDSEAPLYYAAVTDITEWVGKGGAIAALPEVETHVADPARKLACAACDFTRFFQLSSDLLVIIDGEGKVFTVNPAWETTLGFGPGELLGRLAVDLVTPEDRDFAASELGKVMAGGDLRGLVLRILNADGTSRAVRWSAFRDPHQPIVFAIGKDLEELTRIQAEEEQIRSIMESVADPVLSVDESLRIIDVNGATARVFETPTEALLGQSVSRIIPLLASLIADDEEFSSSDAPRAARLQHETIGLRGGDEAFPLRVTVSRARSHGGDSLTVLAQDLTQEHLDRARHLDEVRTLEDSAIRLKLANELHDGLLQSLTGASLQIEIIQKLFPWDPNAARQRLEELQTSIIDEQRELRFFVDEFGSGQGGWGSHDAPLESRLRRLLDRVEGIWNIDCRLSAEIVDEPSVTRAHELLRIAHEGVVNAARHGRSTLIHTALIARPDGTLLRITDNGTGFGFEGHWGHEELMRKRRGPQRLKQRVVDNGGTCEIESSKDGAVVTVRLPGEGASR